MLRRRLTLVISAFCVLPFVLAGAQQTPAQEPTAEQVYKNIQSFKGVPAKDLIPSMKFMCGALNVECESCHDKNDFSADTRMKGTARHMIEMQRDINAKFFNGRNQVTCNSCHNGKEQPSATPVAPGIKTRHERFQTDMKPADFFKKHLDAVGTSPTSLTLTGTMETEKDGKKAYTMVQASDGRYALTSGDTKMGSDGKAVWYSEGGHAFKLDGEGEATVNRFGKAWRGQSAFDGLDPLSISGREPIGKSTSVVVRGTRKADNTTDELYFDQKTGLLSRVVTLTRSTLGTIVTTIDYDDYRSVKGVKVPFRIVTTTAGTQKTTVQFTTGSVAATAEDKLFVMPTGTH